jgi:hypothetical protein
MVRLELYRFYVRVSKNMLRLGLLGARNLKARQVYAILKHISALGYNILKSNGNYISQKLHFVFMCFV